MLTFTISRSRQDNRAVATAVIGGQEYVTTDANPRFGEIVQRLRALDESVVDLFDLEKNLNDALTEFSDGNVRLENGELVVTTDGVDEPAPAALSRLVIKMLEEGSDDYKRFVLFLQKLYANPSHRSRQQLYSFIEAHGVTLTADGDMVLYKGVRADGKGGFTSIASGTAWVNGEQVTGHIPAEVGSTVTMPRRMISDDPNVACHVGLHCGAWDYASRFGDGNTITVLVNPEHVVCVPNDHSFQKIRVCEYRIQGLQEREHAYVSWDRSEDDEPDWAEDEDEGQDYNGFLF